MLVNNAGVGIGGAIADAETKKLDMQLDVNLRAVYLTTREAIPMLKEAGAEHGKALMANTASIAGKYGQGWLAAYSATKFGVVGLTQAIHKEHGKDGIQATALCPGFVATTMTDWVEGVPKEEMIQPEDIAEAIRYLLRTSPACMVPELQFIRPATRCSSSSRSGSGSKSTGGASHVSGFQRRSCSSRTARSTWAWRWSAIASPSTAPPWVSSIAMLASSIVVSVRSSRSVARRGRVAGAGVAVPGPGEAREAGAAAVAVGGEHRADAAARGRCRRRR